MSQEAHSLEGDGTRVPEIVLFHSSRGVQTAVSLMLRRIPRFLKANA